MKEERGTRKEGRAPVAGFKRIGRSGKWAGVLRESPGRAVTVSCGHAHTSVAVAQMCARSLLGIER